jgi:hypothetical protein
MQEEYEAIINKLREEAKEEQAFFSLEYGKKTVNQTEISANRDGIRLFTAKLLEVLVDKNLKEQPIKEEEWYLNAYGISPQYIKIQSTSRKLYLQNKKKKNPLLSGIMPYVIIIAIAVIIMLLMSLIVAKWL